MKINLKIFKKSIRKIKVDKPLNKKGFIILQIDGLSKDALNKSLSLNLMPFLKKLISKENYFLNEYFTGVPSDTPFFQAGLLYGDNDNIPGFRWIDKKTGEEIIFKKPESAGHIEAILSKTHKGLLKGGSSYVNLFSGGASRSTFTLSTFSIRYLFKRKVRNFDIFIIFIFHVFTFCKTIFYVLFEFFLELWERVLDIVKKRPAPPEGIFPFSRAMSNVIFKEIETFGTIMDISRGIPSIYLNYPGYDELSHHRGPYSLSALGTLKAIDRKIKYIFREINKSERKYDLFIISDHGHTPSRSFKSLNNNRTLKDIIYELINDNPPYSGQPLNINNKNKELDDKQNSSLMLFNVYEFDAGYNAALKRLFIYISDFFKKGLCSYIYNRMFNKIKSNIDVNDKAKLIANWDKGYNIYIMNSGPMANIFFSNKPSKMAVEEVEHFYPGLIKNLADNENIGFILGKNINNEVVILDKYSHIFQPLSISYATDFSKSFKNIMERFKTTEKKQVMLESMEKFCNFNNSGDIILFGAYNSQFIVNFENQLGAHGGAGGEQNIPFAVYHKDIKFNFANVNNSCQIYEFLYNNYVA